MPSIVGDRTGHRVLPGMGDSTAHRLGSTAPSAAIGDVRLRLLGERPGNLASGFEVDLDGVAGPRVRDHARAFQSNGRPCVLPRTLRGDGCPSVRAVTSAPRNAGRVAETVSVGARSRMSSLSGIGMVVSMQSIMPQLDPGKLSRAAYQWQDRPLSRRQMRALVSRLRVRRRSVPANSMFRGWTAKERSRSSSQCGIASKASCGGTLKERNSSDSFRNSSCCSMGAGRSPRSKEARHATQMSQNLSSRSSASSGTGQSRKTGS